MYSILVLEPDNRDTHVFQYESAVVPHSGDIIEDITTGAGHRRWRVQEVSHHAGGVAQSILRCVYIVAERMK